MILYVPKYQNSGKLLYEPYASNPYVAESSSAQMPVIQKPLIGKQLENFKAQEKAKAEQKRIASLAFTDIQNLPKNHPDVIAYWEKMSQNQPKLTKLTAEKAEQLEEYTKNVENPSFTDQLIALGKAPLRYISNPLKILGDLETAYTDKPFFPTTQKEMRRDLELRYGKNVNSTEYKAKLEKEKQEEKDDILLNTAIEAGTLGLGKGFNMLRKAKNKTFIPKVNPEKSILDVQKVPSSVNQSSLPMYKPTIIPNPKLKGLEEVEAIKKLIENSKNASSKNMKIIKEGNAYFRALDNPESLKRIEEFSKEYGIDLKKSYEAARKDGKLLLKIL
jgi:hypothetical protein